MDITFYKKYQKFGNEIKHGDVVQLIQVLRVSKDEISREMMDYDTYWHNGEANGNSYISGDEYTILIFRKKQFDPHIFTYIKSYYENSFKYFKSKQGEWFNVVIQETLGKDDKNQRGIEAYL